MGPARALILGVAITAAVGAALIVRGMAKGQPAPVAVVAPAAAAAPAVERPMTEVLIAKRDLPQGTVIVEQDMAWQAWPQDSLNELFITKTSAPKRQDDSAVVKAVEKAATATKDAITGPEAAVAALVGTVVREPIMAGEPMTQRKVVRAGSAGLMAITLEPGARAMAVPLSAESAAGGFILPGDHVDVVQSRQVESTGSGAAKSAVAGTVLRNVKVLAIDQATGAKDAAVVGATATLQVNPQQAEVLVQAKAQGELTLVLRSYADMAGEAETVGTVLGGEPFKAASVVRVFRNGQSSEITVSR